MLVEGFQRLKRKPITLTRLSTSPKDDKSMRLIRRGKMEKGEKRGVGEQGKTGKKNCIKTSRTQTNVNPALSTRTLFDGYRSRDMAGLGPTVWRHVGIGPRRYQSRSKVAG
jgi:hypothetical protein